MKIRRVVFLAAAILLICLFAKETYQADEANQRLLADASENSSAPAGPLVERAAAPPTARESAFMNTQL